MKRRIFIRDLCGTACLLAGFNFAGCSRGKSQMVRWGLITDIHYSDRSPSGSRYYRDSLLKMKDAVKKFNEEPLDFVIELGDFKDQGENPDKADTIGFLDTVEKVFKTCKAETYHVLGNHDMDSISKKDFLAHTSNPGKADGKNYYSFIKKGIKFIVLDANYRKDQTDYDSGNFSWEEAVVPDTETDWLKRELAEGTEPVIIFIHQLLDNRSGLYSGLYVLNADKVNRLLVDSQRVMAVFQGHHHAGNFSVQDGIPYFTMKSIIEGTYPENNSFAIVDILRNGDIDVHGYASATSKYMESRR